MNPCFIVLIRIHIKEGGATFPGPWTLAPRYRRRRTGRCPMAESSTHVGVNPCFTVLEYSFKPSKVRYPRAFSFPDVAAHPGRRSVLTPPYGSPTHVVKSSNHLRKHAPTYCEDRCEYGRYSQYREKYGCGTIDCEAAQSPPATNQGRCCLPDGTYRSYTEPQHGPAPSQRPKGRPRAASAHGRCAWQSRESAANAMMPKGSRPYLRAAAATRARLQHGLHAFQA